MEVEESIQKEGVGKDASVKGLGSCYRVKRGICAEKGESLLIVKRGERRGTSICGGSVKISQTSFGHICISSLTVPTVLMAPKSPWKDLSIDTTHVLKRLVMAEILGKSTGNYYGTIY